MTLSDPALTATAQALNTVTLYDTTLRDGAQQEGLSLSVEDKIRIAHHLDQLGIPLVEGGWPGANPRMSSFFGN